MRGVLTVLTPCWGPLSIRAGTSLFLLLQACEEGSSQGHRTAMHQRSAAVSLW